ncbi:RidA family protein [Streptomyces alfalfae]|uniref:Protein DfrA n=2 Tax=Streptomyces alfalfae TaxID=1642299 RepID=A0ABM6GYE8_9ACTN|nr:protein DfrA [Streptomyces alfalfae]AYA19273.1 RidA family protein [Streptomyces fradiae]RXX36098.1 RidA family protein [Streptomyces alfalfae]RZN03892.1 RidA family protein [Streptomyces alfalfae]
MRWRPGAPHHPPMAPSERTVVPTLFPPPGYAHAAVVEAGARLAFMAGSVPLDPAGRLVGEGDVTRQTEQVIANLDEALRAVGSDLSQVVASTVYVVSDEVSALSEAWAVVRASALHAGPHTSTLLGTTCLGYPGQLVEITATAVVPEGAGAGPDAEGGA